MKSLKQFFLKSYIKYPLPLFLQGRVSLAVYDKWLNERANTLHIRDLQKKRPYAVTATKGVYKEKIHAAVNAAGEFDPYTGDPLQWELIGTWDAKKAKERHDDYKSEFALMPTIDHIDPDFLEFEICSWLINDSKCGMNPKQFLELCQRIIAFRSERKKTGKSPFTGKTDIPEGVQHE